MKSDTANYSQRAKYYDLEFNNEDDKEIINLLITSGSKRILEIPCGSGRNLNWLARTGKKVVFCDLSSEMVKIVNAKIRALPFSHKASAVCADMTSYKNNNKFDLILVLRESIQLLSSRDLLKSLLNFRKNLSSSGLLYLDFAVLNPNKITEKSKLPEYIKQQGNNYTLDINYQNKSLSFKRWHRSLFKGGVLKVNFKYEVLNREQKMNYSSSIALVNYEYDYLMGLFKKVGLSLSAIYGNYDMDPYTPKSERMIFILKINHE